MESIAHSQAFDLMAGTPEWLDPLITALVGVAGGGGFVAYVNRDKTRKEGELAGANARVAEMEAESLAVKTVKEALIEVKELSTAKDSQIHEIRAEMREQATSHDVSISKQAAAHAEALRGMEQRMAKIQESQIKIASALAAHGQWDLYALAQLRRLDPDFPEPPPLVLFPDPTPDGRTTTTTTTTTDPPLSV